MTSRAESDLLLVGSLPADNTEQAFRAGAELFGDLVFALPDGETGKRAAWVGFERNELFMPHPSVETVQRPESPDGIPRHAYDTPTFQLAAGTQELALESWPRIDEAIASYQVFRSLREQGTIPAGIRFQIGLPFPGSAIMGGFKENFAADYPIAERGFEAMVARELDRLFEEIPAEDLAIQWDICYEVLDNEGVLAWTSEGAWERYAGPSSRLPRLVPENVPMGYHLCYGTFPEWPMYEARDMGLMVRMANAGFETAGRPIDWLHLAGPRYLRSEDDRYFEPLRDLRARDTTVYLGIVLPMDGEKGLARRAKTASCYLSGFGVAMYCGFGRQPGKDPAETMREHRRVVQSWKG